MMQKIDTNFRCGSINFPIVKCILVLMSEYNLKYFSCFMSILILEEEIKSLQIISVPPFLATKNISFYIFSYINGMNIVAKI